MLAAETTWNSNGDTATSEVITEAYPLRLSHIEQCSGKGQKNCSLIYNVYENTAFHPCNLTLNFEQQNASRGAQSGTIDVNGKSYKLPYGRLTKREVIDPVFFAGLSSSALKGKKETFAYIQFAAVSREPNTPITPDPLEVKLIVYSEDQTSKTIYYCGKNSIEMM